MTPPPPPPPVPARAPQKTSALAIWSLVLAILGPCTAGISAIAALICGFIALGNIGQAQRGLSGRGLAIAGIVVAGVSLVLVPILASLAVPVFHSVKEKSEIVYTMNTARQLELALQLYETEYGQFPVAAPASDGDLTGEVDAALLSALSGNVGPLNPRGIAFIGGLKAESDRWGHPFHFALDLNGDGQVTVPGPGPTGTRSLQRTVAVWSLGPDGEPGGQGPHKADIFLE